MKLKIKCLVPAGGGYVSKVVENKPLGKRIAFTGQKTVIMDESEIKPGGVELLLKDKNLEVENIGAEKSADVVPIRKTEPADERKKK